MTPSEPNSSPATGLVNPVFPGGMEALTAFVEETKGKLAAPSPSFDGGTVFVEFVVNIDGTVGNIVVLKGLGRDADLEATRIVTAMPQWTPGTLHGKPVRVKLVLPISFAAN